MITAALSAILLSYLINWAVRTIARSHGWVAGPRSLRHIHDLPIPRLGGIGVFLSFAAVVTATEILHPYLLNQAGFIRLLIPASLMFTVGICDDFRPVSAKFKLAVQIVSGILLFLWIRSTPLGISIGSLEIGDTGLFIGTIVWVVLVSNSINLIDGVDGLAAGTAVLTLASIACVAWRAGRTEVALVAIVLIGSVLGFLKYNFHPATMFLGDGGSLFIGFMISVLGIIWGDSRTLVSSVGIAVAILALPLAETGVSVARRFLSGRPLFSPDREHMHHKLLDRGLTQRQAVYVLYALALICGLSGIAIAIGGPYVFAISFVILSLILTVGISSLGYVEFLEVGRIVKRLFEQRRVMANDVKLRKVARLVQSGSCIAELGDELRASLRALQFDNAELSLVPWVAELLHCRRQASRNSWGLGANDKAAHDACWTIKLDLKSEKHGSLGCLLLCSNIDHGDLLFDANLLITDLQPAFVGALEHCIDVSSQCSGDKVYSVGWMPLSDHLAAPVMQQRLADDAKPSAVPAQPISGAKAND
ncbi:MAG: glycosyltransferase family 4 protein [Acidobacteriaceae bacterium]